MPLNILIIGAGVGGPITAWVMLRANPDHQITIIERSTSLRATGQQIDLRAQGIPLIRKMGLLDAIRKICVPERGIEFIGRDGKIKARIEMNDTGTGNQSLTSEFEIMRGDMVELLYDLSIKESEKARGKGSIKYEFGKTAETITQNEKGVDITFSDGAKGQYDLVIGADGQGSRTRDQIFGKEVSAAGFKSFGYCSAFYSIPPKDDGLYARIHHTPGRLTLTRPSKPDLTGVYLMSVLNQDELQAAMKQPVEKQKEVWAKLYKDWGWQEDRMIEGMKNTPDFYSYTVGQMKLKNYVKGRVALLGDAAYVPSPASGMGTTCAIVGAYVLAGELTRHGDDVPGALRRYEELMRPLVVEAQKLFPGFPGVAIPKTSLGITLLHLVLAFVTTFKIDKLLNHILPENNGGWVIPDYPELKFDS